jgi:geranylgeranyl reductase family protein
VIGAGPAGATAAFALAARGLKTIILEKSQLPRYKTCGGGLLPKAIRLLNANLDSVTEHQSHEIEFALSSRLRFRVSRSEPIITMTMRDKLDMLLTQRAIDAGACLRCCEVIDVKPHVDHVILLTRDDEIQARFVIAADGANSTIAKKAGFANHARVAAALEYEVHVSSADHERLSHLTRFDFIVPRGYAWVFPKASHLSIGVLATQPSGINLRKIIDAYMSDLGIDRPLLVERHGFVIPLHPRKKFASSRILLTGDAAGLADPITAEGISNAIHSAQLAAAAIGDGNLSPQEVSSRYERSIKTEILPELKWAKRLATLLYEMPRLRNVLFALHGQKLAEVMMQIVTGEKTYSALISRPLNYLKLLRKN